jgi:hypothetical protein
MNNEYGICFSDFLRTCYIYGKWAFMGISSAQHGVTDMTCEYGTIRYNKWLYFSLLLLLPPSQVEKLLPMNDNVLMIIIHCFLLICVTLVQNRNLTY